MGVFGVVPVALWPNHWRGGEGRKEGGGEKERMGLEWVEVEI